MLLFRSLAVGLLGACLYFVVSAPPAPAAPPPIPPVIVQAPSAVTVLDVAPGVDADEIAAMIRLDDGERVTAVGERRVENDLAAGVAMHAVTDDYVDLTIQGPLGERRVLVLRH
ncbi:MAG: hypothetical protein KF773_40965 [Deltaproteobacteria bacterium]|nr:hypothetical protein [Deltaproteobacteria bacterium]MCW5807132.1 hypothetical protein [Deltaproteobacteria bacterium]